MIPPSWSHLAQQLGWLSTQIVAYLVLPLLVSFAIGTGLRGVGWGVAGLSRHWKPYVVIAILATPFVAAASTTESFQNRYPLFGLEPGVTGIPAELLIWWVFYAVQFVAVESFFRGFLVIGLSQRFGAASVFIAISPYLAIHFSKPAAEAVASIIGGLVMGMLALRTKSIWLGTLVHIYVAGLIDVLVLWQTGVL